MGYIHYFSFKSSRPNAMEVEALYQKAIKDCQKVINYYQKLNKGTLGGLSGYSAYTSNYGGININGKRKYGHETFILREHFNQNESFNFCKTARKPYDIVVVACLAILKFHLKEYVEVSSDGHGYEWNDGINFANKVLRRTKNKIPVPFKDEVATLQII